MTRRGDGVNLPVLCDSTQTGNWISLVADAIVFVIIFFSVIIGLDPIIHLLNLFSFVYTVFGRYIVI
jgi:hypothetical protein